MLQFSPKCCNFRQNCIIWKLNHFGFARNCWKVNHCIISLLHVTENCIIWKLHHFGFAPNCWKVNHLKIASFCVCYKLNHLKIASFRVRENCIIPVENRNVMWYDYVSTLDYIQFSSIAEFSFQLSKVLGDRWWRDSASVSLESCSSSPSWHSLSSLPLLYSSVLSSSSPSHHNLDCGVVFTIVCRHHK